MKKQLFKIAFIFIAFLAQYPFYTNAQSCIEYKETGITIRAYSIDESVNQIRYTVNAPIEFLDIAQDLLNISLPCKDGLCSADSYIYIPNLPNIYKAYQIEQSDVGKSLEFARQTFGANLILNFGNLNLDYNWTLKNK